MSLTTEQSILATLHYFDLFDYPLTLEEMHQYLYSPPKELVDIALVLHCLDNVLINRGDVLCIRGLYTLKGRDHIVSTRLERYESVHWKYKKAVRYGRLLAMLPFVRMVAVCNELAYGNARDESDIDLYIVARRKYLWITRLFCSTAMEILGQRPNIATKEKRDALCLSFLASDLGLNCKSLLLPTHDGVPDIQFVYWVTQVVPIYDKGGVYDKFYKENTWVEEYLPFRIIHGTHRRRVVFLPWWRRWVKFLSEGVLGLFGLYPETLARKFQMAILPLYLKKHLNAGTHVIMNDTVMKMHPSDKREQTRQAFMKRLALIISSV